MPMKLALTWELICIAAFIVTVIAHDNKPSNSIYIICALSVIGFSLGFPAIILIAIWS